MSERSMTVPQPEGAPPALCGQARFSRSGQAHPMGKCDATLEVPMPTTMRGDLNAVAHLMRTTSAELTRSLLTDWLYGKTLQLKRIVDR